MDEFVRNFISGDPFTLIAVSLAVFSIVMLFLMLVYNFRLELNSKNASLLVVLLLIIIALPLTLEPVSKKNLLISQASEPLTVSNIIIEPIASKTYEVRFKTNLPVTTYLSYQGKMSSSVMLPELNQVNKKDHTIIVKNLPESIKTMTIISNNKPTSYSITIPQILQR